MRTSLTEVVFCISVSNLPQRGRGVSLWGTMREMKPAFTLVELLTVIAVIGILCAVAIPSMNLVTENAQVQQGAEGLADLMRAAHEQSQNEQIKYGVLIDQLNKQATLVSYGDCADPSTSGTTIQTITLPKSVEIFDLAIQDPDTQETSVWYSCNGLPSTTGAASLWFRTHQATTVWKLTLQPAGSVQIAQQ